MHCFFQKYNIDQRKILRRRIFHLQQWRDSATQALAEPAEKRVSPQQTKEDRRRIKELERELRRKDKALAETAALLVLSKKVSAIFNKDKGEDE